MLLALWNPFNEDGGNTRVGTIGTVPTILGTRLKVTNLRVSITLSNNNSFNRFFLKLYHISIRSKDSINIMTLLLLVPLYRSFIECGSNFWNTHQPTSKRRVTNAIMVPYSSHTKVILHMLLV